MSIATRDGPLKRKLAVILASDVAGYSALIATDEEQTIRRFTEASRIMHDMIESQSGRVFNTAGDAILAEFDSAVNAVRCAIDIQEALATGNSDFPDRALRLRIGIAIGDVVVAANGDLLGDGVNIAARLEALSQPGGVCISRDVQQLVQNKIALGFEDLGAQELKNIPQPVHAYRIQPGILAHTPLLSPAAPASRRVTPFQAGFAALTCLALISAGVFAWQRSGSQTKAAVSIEPALTFDAAKVPLVTEDVRRRLIPGYVQAGNHKALAISNDGDFYGVAVNAPDEATAIERARETCERDSTAAHKRPCFIYAAGTKIVQSADNFPMPRADEIISTASGQVFGTADTPLGFMQQGPRLSREYPATKKPKALAIGTRGDGVWGAMSTGETEAEAMRRALEFCGFRTRSPCVLYAVGADLVTRPPAARKINGVLLIAADKTIPVLERQRLLDLYQAGDWQALAYGRNGTWHAAAGAASEAAATHAAMAKCNSADRDCRVYAIGRFLVAD
jgi:class 3 adenylate cyclase